MEPLHIHARAVVLHLSMQESPDCCGAELAIQYGCYRGRPTGCSHPGTRVFVFWYTFCVFYMEYTTPSTLVSTPTHLICQSLSLLTCQACLSVYQGFFWGSWLGVVLVYIHFEGLAYVLCFLFMVSVCIHASGLMRGVPHPFKSN